MFRCIGYHSIVVLAGLIFSFGTVFADSSFEDLVDKIDQTYVTLVKSMPKTAKIFTKLQNKFWSNLEIRIKKILVKAKWDKLLIYQTLLTKIQQRSDKIKTTTEELLTQWQVINETNNIRKEQDLSQLVYSYVLYKAAYKHAKDMYDHFPYDADNNGVKDTLSHIWTDWSVVKDRVEDVWYSWTYLGENVARWQTIASTVVQDWMNSPAHRDNILSDDYTEIGVAKVGMYRVQVFGKPRVNK